MKQTPKSSGLIRKPKCGDRIEVSGPAAITWLGNGQVAIAADRRVKIRHKRRKTLDR
jgi:hypothetical protein